MTDRTVRRLFSCLMATAGLLGLTLEQVIEAPQGILLNCTFEEQSICNFTFDRNHSDWIWHRGGTPTNDTGPNGDHTTGVGNYMYMEAKGKVPDYSARLIFPFIQGISLQRCLRFFYHMEGTLLGSLEVVSINSTGSVVLRHWSRIGRQGPDWKQAIVNITDGAGDLAFIAVRGTSALGDIAIDDVIIENGTCPGNGDVDIPTTTDSSFETSSIWNNAFSDIHTYEPSTVLVTDNSYITQSSTFSNMFSDTTGVRYVSTQQVFASSSSVAQVLSSSLDTYSLLPGATPSSFSPPSVATTQLSLPNLLVVTADATLQAVSSSKVTPSATAYLQLEVTTLTELNTVSEQTKGVASNEQASRVTKTIDANQPSATFFVNVGSSHTSPFLTASNVASNVINFETTTTATSLISATTNGDSNVKAFPTTEPKQGNKDKNKGSEGEIIAIATGAGGGGLLVIILVTVAVIAAVKLKQKSAVDIYEKPGDDEEIGKGSHSADKEADELETNTAQQMEMSPQ
ncbi:MAM and LDL-receptor class A domain-containing protein 1 [Lingula anatina]|uniref:MAM and LDL-receptor class A domain-containing protein 1 n=1 Tax=Lingula anatina TaxID=7574 RepID=A0A1S3HUB6_LINAN|nr:MAM and LDL-receptor class A domain-containing protein 1 [Lingula anatina]|eukprot:XP_013389136.1 MAM and LDL-receptor class A domain-containing protein 1 [Lingula anatina]